MNLRHLQLLLSCHGWEDFPIHATGDDAENLMAGWTALWHPALISASQSVPQWQRVDSPPDDCADYLLIAPNLCRDQLPTGFQQRVKDQGGLLIEQGTRRSEFASTIFQHYQLDSSQSDSAISNERVQDFYALGFVFLQLQILTRQYRYASSLDEAQFERLCIEAATAASKSDDEFTEALQKCFDLLSEERHRYFSNEIWLIDTTLVTPTLLDGLARQLEWNIDCNLHLPDEILPALGQHEKFPQIKQAIVDGKFCVVGGEALELKSSLLSFGSLANQFLQGEQVYSEHLGRPADIFGRQKFGVSPAHPELIQQSGMSGAVHSVFDDGRFPTHFDRHIHWQGFSKQAVSALADPPFDTAAAENFFQLPGKISQAIDNRHMAVVQLAHWAGKQSDWYRDLINAAKYGATIGTFISLRQFFEQETETDTTQQWLPDDYLSPDHRQSIISGETDNISRWARYWQDQTRLNDAVAAQAMCQPFDSDSTEDLSTLRSAIEQQTRAAETDLKETSQSVQDALSNSLTRFVNVTSSNTDPSNTSSNQAAGYLLINPQPSARREYIELNVDSVTCDDQDAIYAQEYSGGKLQVVVDVQGLGFTFLKPGSSSQKMKSNPLPLVDGYILRNEFFQLTADKSTGGIRSLQVYNERGNLLSQQLAFRQSDRRQSRGKRNSASYSRMQADKVEVTEQSLIQACLESSGKLFIDDNAVANFRQHFTVTRGIRTAQLKIMIEPLAKVRSDPWNEYICCRTAFGNDSAQLFRWTNDSRTGIAVGRFESPICNEIDLGTHRLTLFSGGAPFHRRDGYRKLDTILVPAHETQSEFNLAYGVDVKNPLLTAYHLLSPLQVQQLDGQQPMAATGWVYHFSGKNVLPFDWKCLGNKTEIWFKETEGKQGNLKITCPENPQQAKLVDLRGDTVANCEVAEDRITVPIAGHSFYRLSIDW